MTSLWTNDGAGWSLLAPVGFPLEADLHSLVEQAPQVLPLSGTPRLSVVGREVALGTGSADLIAVERDGRVAVIEVKLSKNAEARRAVVAQILAYAAALQGTDPAAFESDVLGEHLRRRGYEGLAAAVAADAQEGVFDPALFAQGLAASLAEGRFRLVLVLDAAPSELVQLVGYLEMLTDKLVIDLVTVSQFEVNGSRIVVPQRIDPERRAAVPTAQSGATRGSEPGQYALGSERFEQAIEATPPEQRAFLARMLEWARALEKEGFAQLGTYEGRNGIVTLLPYPPGEQAGMITVWKDVKSAYIQVWRKVFERRAPTALGQIEALLGPGQVRQGSTVREVPDALLSLLTQAYREAASSRQVVVTSSQAEGL